MTTHYEIVSHRQARDFRGCGWTWTVGALIDYLSELDQDAPIVVRGYDGNLYNNINMDTIEEVEE